MPEKFLFVGGPVDGQRIDTGGRIHWKVSVAPPLAVPPDPNPDTVAVREVKYQGVRFPDVGLIYLAPGVTTPDLFRLLVEHYRPGVPFRMEHDPNLNLFAPEDREVLAWHHMRTGSSAGTFLLPLPQPDTDTV